MEQQYITIGEITAPYGYHGDLRVRPLTDFPQRFKSLGRVFVNKAGQLLERAVERTAVQQGQIVLKLAGIDSPEQVKQFRGSLLQVPREELWPLEEGAYYQFEIIGLRVVTVDGQALGEISEILTTGGNDVYVVRDGTGQECLVPALRTIVREIDTSAGRMVIDPPPGLLDGDQ